MGPLGDFGDSIEDPTYELEKDPDYIEHKENERTDRMQELILLNSRNIERETELDTAGPQTSSPGEPTGNLEQSNATRKRKRNEVGWKRAVRKKSS